jgi:hypothetical protein
MCVWDVGGDDELRRGTEVERQRKALRMLGEAEERVQLATGVGDVLRTDCSQSRSWARQG